MVVISIYFQFLTITQESITMNHSLLCWKKWFHLRDVDVNDGIQYLSIKAGPKFVQFNSIRFCWWQHTSAHWLNDKDQISLSCKEAIKSPGDFIIIACPEFLKRSHIYHTYLETDIQTDFNQNGGSCNPHPHTIKKLLAGCLKHEHLNPKEKESRCQCRGGRCSILIDAMF